MSNRIVCQVSIGIIDSTFIVEGLNYSPDVANDMLNRVRVGLVEAVQLAHDFGISPDNQWIPLGEDTTVEELEEMLGELDADDTAE
jgi:hypothetical protein